MKGRVLAAATTLAGMELQQLVGVGRRKLRSELYPRVGRSLARRYEPETAPTLQRDALRANAALLSQHVSEETRADADQQTERLLDGTVSFLNQPVSAGDCAPYDVAPDAGQVRGYPLLWSLKLWSLEPVRWLLHGSGGDEALVADTLVRWLASWQARGLTDLDSPGYLRRYWTPYAVSRRIDNLARLAALGRASLTAAQLDRLATHLETNVRFLCDHVEYDVGGNHLLENGCALAVGGVALGDAEVVDQGVGILEEELPAQLRDDGLHFELSPMYHTILLYRVASAVDLLERDGYGASQSLWASIGAMQMWLTRVAPPDAPYPLLNDAAHHEAPSRETCLRTVAAIAGTDRQQRQHTPASAYYTLRNGDVTALVDGGRPCPPHLPAHGHNDAGNVLAWVEATPLLVDSGVYNYDANSRRDYARSVAAHNTVQVGSVAQAPITGKYMMGPRLEPTATVSDSDAGRTVTVEYAAPKLFQKYRHRRAVTVDTDGLRVEDSVASARETATSRFHLHPDWAVERVAAADGVAFRIASDGAPTVRFTVDGAETVNVTETEYYPEYGRVETQPTLEATFEPSEYLDSAPLRQTFTAESA